MFKKIFTKLTGKTKQVIAYDEVKKNHDTHIGIMKSLFTPKKSTRTETFEIAKQRLQLTEQDIKNTYSTLYFIWFISVLFLILSASMQIIYLYQDAYLGAMSLIGLEALLCALILDKQFRMFQIRNRNLCSLQYFLKSNDKFPLSLK